MDLLKAMRRILLAILVLGLAGTGAELLLLGHVETLLQAIPVLLVGVGLGLVVCHLLTERQGVVRALQATMTLFVLSGVTGILLHYRSNEEFELEMHPSLAGLDLFKETMTGAIPTLAPGAMIQLGLIGLAYSFSHRSSRSDSAVKPMTKETAS